MTLTDNVTLCPILPLPVLSLSTTPLHFPPPSPPLSLPPFPLPSPLILPSPSLSPQLKESECTSLVNKLEVAEARYSALEYRLRADHEEHFMATRELERQVMDAGDSITALNGELEKSRTTEVGGQDW